ncbi:MAG: aminotransferase class IV [Kiritimatiellae bacterium]|nr:aminotransferase class IV [Kiritimatiellia bacterium]MDD5520616.1 aminotransferase class IV [Kiritimatiellia bacterium]
MKRFDKSSFDEVIEVMRREFQKNYFAMYSSVYGGIVTDPSLMMVPIDDHMVHRGDGVFETFKCVNGSIYNMKAHLDRLIRSASGLYYKFPWSPAQIGEIVIETIKAGGRKNCMIRLFVSRGPGSFDANPYDCSEPQLYVVATFLKKPFMEMHPDGAVVRTSRIPVKEPFFAAIKNCNYLPNVLMKKEAIDLKADFVAAFDGRGFLAEGATENMGIVTKEKELLFPRLEGILRGTTMMRIVELAEIVIKEGILINIGFKDISHHDILDAEEVLIVGTTLNVVSVHEFDGIHIGGKKSGVVYSRLNTLLVDDILNNKQLLTPVPGLA